jgi:hypothetical protein
MSWQLVTRGKHRFQTDKGMLSVEQLWDLPLADLDRLAVQLEHDSKKHTKTFLKVKTQEDKITKAMFDVVLDVLNTKVEEQEAAEEARANKEHNEKIFRLIEEKEDEHLGKLTVKQLKAQLR